MPLKKEPTFPKGLCGVRRRQAAGQRGPGLRAAAQQAGHGCHSCPDRRECRAPVPAPRGHSLSGLQWGVWLGSTALGAGRSSSRLRDALLGGCQLARGALCSSGHVPIADSASQGQGGGWHGGREPGMADGAITSPVPGVQSAHGGGTSRGWGTSDGEEPGWAELCSGTGPCRQGK